MRVLDRYIIRQFLTNVFALFAIFFAFIIAIDVSLNFADFWELARKWALLQSPGEKPGIFRLTGLSIFLVADFWWPNLLRLFNFMLGLVMVGSMGFTISQMVKHRELVATLSSGISLFRIGRPIVLCACVLLGLQLVNREYILPQIAPLLVRDRDAAGQRLLGATPVPLTSDGQGRLFYARAFDPDRGVLTDVTIFERSPEGDLERRISAQQATWDSASSTWKLTNGKVDRKRGSLPAGGAAAIPITSISSPLDPVQLKLRRFAGYAQNLSFSQVSQLINQPDLLDTSTRTRLDELQRVRFNRFSVVICNLLTLITSLAFYLRREPGNMLIQSLKCAPVALVSLLGGILASAANIPGIPPAVGVFIPCVILLPISIASINSIRT
jgi:lipopolysaccharide export LptBFGC system permease protein LptF